MKERDVGGIREKITRTRESPLLLVGEGWSTRVNPEER